MFKIKFSKKVFLVAGLVILSAGCVFTAIQLTMAETLIPNPGHSYLDIELPADGAVWTGLNAEFLQDNIPEDLMGAGGGGACSLNPPIGCYIGIDFDGDEYTALTGDCDESCSTCYEGSTHSTSIPDGKDQNCDGVIDDLEIAPCINKKYWGYEHNCTWAQQGGPWIYSRGNSVNFGCSGENGGCCDCVAIPVFDRDVIGENKYCGSGVYPWYFSTAFVQGRTVFTFQCGTQQGENKYC